MSKIEIEELQRKLEATPPEAWERMTKEVNEKQAELDRRCASGDHQGILSNPTFSGADIYWRCSRCGRSSLQIGGNKPLLI